MLTEYTAMHEASSAVSNPVLTVSHPEAAKEVKILEKFNSSAAIHPQAQIINCDLEPVVNLYFSEVQFVDIIPLKQVYPASA